MVLLRSKLPRLAHSHFHSFVQPATAHSVHQIAAPNEGENGKLVVNGRYATSVSGPVES